ncbi:MAG TPA: PfkB family carbohydrate kinase [Gaiellaceae bacterium]|nr:PfkB family carbohydrate kinase [Gaiellaceae bacterium]
MRFVAVGELLVDVVADGSGHDAHIRLSPAGSAFNAAVAAVAAGAEATVVGTVGDDPGGRMILAELANRGVTAEVTVSEGTTGTFLLADGEIRVDRGVSHDLVLPGRIGADAVLVSGYVAAAGEALARADASLVALDAARLTALPPGGNAVFASGPHHDVHRLAEGRRLAVVTHGARGAEAVLDGRLERVAPERTAADAPGSGDVFAATLLVTLGRGEELAGALSEATRAALDSLA